MKVVFFGSSDFVIQVLESLNETQTVLAVITTPDAPVGRKKTLTETPVAEAAKKLKLPVLKFESLKTVETLTELSELQADIFVVASYGKIIPQTILNLPQFGVINIHPSLLPIYRGPTPIQTALRNGDTTTGVSIIKMDAEVDHGPLLGQTSTNIEPNETFRGLSLRLFGLSIPLLNQALSECEAGTSKPTEQDHVNATFTKSLAKEDGQIDWSEPADKIFNQFRAYDPWPGLWTKWDGQFLKILDCKPSDMASKSSPGTVIEPNSVVCGNGTTLTLISVQIEGKQPTDIQSFIRGHKSFVGSQLL
ncbi:MAG: methionyl-tRNA formyltransferase [Candidatus Doudnabacteria bacterium]|nr:methionyl-tRNA formyltransferase [Candidatus Doudnabacteria bacterium]